jgi:hypothetical protein
VWTTVFLAQQQSIQQLQETVASLQRDMLQLQEREVKREMGWIHHAGNPVVIEDLEGDTAVDSEYGDVVEVQVVTELIEIID